MSKDNRVYDRCSKCRVDKKANRAPYCPSCQKEYSKNLREIKRDQPQINLDGLGKFIYHLKHKRYDPNRDISNLLFFYDIISKTPSEYDAYSGKYQVYLMWYKLNLYYLTEILIQDFGSDRTIYHIDDLKKFITRAISERDSMIIEEEY